MKIVALNTSEKDYDYEKNKFSKIEGCKFIISPAVEKSDVIAAVRDAGVILFSSITIDKEIVDSLQSCRLIVRYGIGYDNIDTEACAAKGIYVCNAPNYGVVDVAEHAVALMMSCAKRIPYMHDCARSGIWYTDEMGASRRISGKTVGFVGFGKIARCVCGMTNAMGAKAMVYDPYVDSEVTGRYNSKKADFAEVLKAADYLTLHLPLSEATRHIIGKKELEMMKRDAIIINTGRGGLINQPELIDALENGVIGGAGLDVFEQESGMLDERLTAMKNVSLTPHVAWNTLEATEAIHKEVTDNVVSFLKGNRPQSVVNNL